MLYNYNCVSLIRQYCVVAGLPSLPRGVGALRGGTPLSSYDFSRSILAYILGKGNYKILWPQAQIYRLRPQIAIIS